MSPNRASPMLYCNSIMAQVQHRLRLLSLLIPLIGITAGALKWNSAAIFTLNIVAVIPLGLWINRSVDSLTAGGSRVVKELLKSTLGNSVELMVISSSGGLNLQFKHKLTIIYLDWNQCDRTENTTYRPVCDTWKRPKQFTPGNKF